jgi:hypothetical protein
MPSQEQLDRALAEKADLERELQLLSKAKPPEESAAQIIEFVKTHEEPLLDPQNQNPGGCSCAVL